jgi:hypothetical protein
MIELKLSSEMLHVQCCSGQLRYLEKKIVINDFSEAPCLREEQVANAGSSIVCLVNRRALRLWRWLKGKLAVAANKLGKVGEVLANNALYLCEALVGCGVLCIRICASASKADVTPMLDKPGVHAAVFAGGSIEEQYA